MLYLDLFIENWVTRTWNICRSTVHGAHGNCISVSKRQKIKIKRLGTAIFKNSADKLSVGKVSEENLILHPLPHSFHSTKRIKSIFCWLDAKPIFAIEEEDGGRKETILRHCHLPWCSDFSICEQLARCDQIGLFRKVWATNFLAKVAQMFGNCLACFDKCNF